MPAAPYSLTELANHAGCELRGDGDTLIQSVAPLTTAGTGQLSFLHNSRYRSALPSTGASAVIVSPEDAQACPCSVLVCDNPYAAFARIATWFDTRQAPEPGVHSSAVVATDVDIGAGCSIGPLVSIGSTSSLGRGCRIDAGAVIGANVVLADGVHIEPRAVISDGTRVGPRSIVHAGAVLGSDGFGLAQDDDGWRKLPQLGNVVIGADCEIGANTTIDRGALEDTVLEDDVRLDNQIQIAHNVRIGAHTAMAGCSAVAGSSQIGQNCLVAGGAGILGHLTIADGVTITAMSLVTRSITEPDSTWSSGTPLQDTRQWRRSAVRFKQLESIHQRLQYLETNESSD